MGRGRIACVVGLKIAGRATGAAMKNWHSSAVWVCASLKIIWSVVEGGDESLVVALNRSGAL